MSDTLETWDIIALACYFVIVFAVGLVATCRANRGNAEGFFLAGKSMTILPIAGSLYATNIGAPSFVGMAGSAAGVGFAPVMFEWHATYMLILLGWVFVPIYIASSSFTIPEYLRKRYGGQRLRVCFALVQLMLNVLAGISGELFAGSLFINQILGWNIYLSTVLILLVTSVYTIGGGLTAVMYTDTIQAVIIVLGALVLCGLALDEVGGYQAMINQFHSSASNNTYFYQATAGNLSCGLTPEDSTSLFRGMDSDYPWPGLVFGLTLLATYFFCTNQTMVQRNLAAKNVSHSKGACVLTSYLKMLPMILFIIPGMISRILFPDEIACSDPDECERICDNRGGCSDISYPLLVLRIMPTGMKGIMLAGLLAALMGSLTSQYNSCSSMFSMDVWKYFRRKCGKNPGNKELVIVGRIFGGILVGISIAWLPILQKMKGTRLWDYLQSVQSYITPPWVVVFLTGMFWKRGTEEAAWWSVIIGLIIGVTRMIIDFSNPAPRCGSGKVDDRPSIITEIHFLHFAILLAGICLIVYVVVSLMTKPREEKQLHRVTWWTRDHEEEPEFSDESDWSDEEVDDISSEELTMGQRIYNAACGFGESGPKLTEEEAAEQRKIMTDISEDPLITQICDINGVLAVTLTCFIIGFYN